MVGLLFVFFFAYGTFINRFHLNPKLISKTAECIDCDCKLVSHNFHTNFLFWFFIRVYSNEIDTNWYKVVFCCYFFLKLVWKMFSFSQSNDDVFERERERETCIYTHTYVLFCFRALYIMRYLKWTLASEFVFVCSVGCNFKLHLILFLFWKRKITSKFLAT